MLDFRLHTHIHLTTLDDIIFDKHILDTVLVSHHRLSLSELGLN
jgi:hypothetical protein